MTFIRSLLFMAVLVVFTPVFIAACR